MKDRTLKKALLVWGVLCVLLVCLGQSMARYFSAAVAFPFEQIGAGLRLLSLSGGAGNGVAILLYALLSLLPLGCFAWRYVKNKRTAADYLLPAVSIGLFAALYLFINPGDLGAWNNPVGKSMLGGTLYSLVVAYGVLRLLHSARQADGPRLYRMLQRLLTLLCFVLVWAAVGSGLSDLMAQVNALHDGNTDRSALTVSYLVLGLRFVVSGLPYLLDVWVIFAGKRLLHAMGRKDDEAAVRQADELGRRCGAALVAVVVTGALFNVAQLLLGAHARHVDVTLLLPLDSLVLLLCVLLLARLVRDVKRIRDENDSFI